MNVSLTREQHLELYYYMKLNRMLEEQMVRLFRQNKIVGGLYSSLGQEATSVGTAYALEPRDWMAPMIRNIGALLVKGLTAREDAMPERRKAAEDLKISCIRVALAYQSFVLRWPHHEAVANWTDYRRAVADMAIAVRAHVERWQIGRAHV